MSAGRDGLTPADRVFAGAGVDAARDARLAAACLAAGGFPRLLTLGDGRTVWAWPGARVGEAGA